MRQYWRDERLPSTHFAIDRLEGLAGGAAEFAFGAYRVDIPLRPERVQPSNGDAADLLGHARVEPKYAVVGLETEHRLQKDEGGSGGPRLGTAGGGIRNGFHVLCRRQSHEIRYDDHGCRPSQY